MYKKRYAAWGFYKNSRRAQLGTNGEHPAAAEPRRETGGAKQPAAVQKKVGQTVPLLALTPSTTRYETLSLFFMTKIHEFVRSYYDKPALSPLPPSIDSPDGSTNAPSFIPYSQPFDSEPINRSIKLTAELLGRGHGLLAGKLARKAFLHLDGMFSLESPILLWNLTEMMYNMATKKQFQLLRLFLAQLSGLSRKRLVPGHPLPQLLHALNSTLDLLDPCIETESLLQKATELSMTGVVENFTPQRVALLQGVLWDSATVRVPGIQQAAMRTVRSPPRFP